MNDRPYLFVCYAPKNRQQALFVIRTLQTAGISLWHREQEPWEGAQTEQIAQRLLSCDRVLFFVTQASLQSQECYREILFTLQHDKELLLVYLEEARLTPGQMLLFHKSAAVSLNHYPSLHAMACVLSEMEFFAPCRAPRTSMPAPIRCISFPNGDRYEGELLRGRRHGKGVYFYANGDRYEGDYADDKRHGKGKYTWASGEVYEGDFLHDKRTGEGSYLTADGKRYEGSFREGKPVDGVLFDPQGAPLCRYEKGTKC